ncbi:hypothetical protein NG726_12570 [Pseudomonas sp. MOB-449]|nr:hypothetical protein [Pseudomonas sp. MOB-449]
MVFKKLAISVVASGFLAIVASAASAAQTISFVSWGGMTQDAQKQAWAEPFSEASGLSG